MLRQGNNPALPLTGEVSTVWVVAGGLGRMGRGPADRWTVNKRCRDHKDRAGEKPQMGINGAVDAFDTE